MLAVVVAAAARAAPDDYYKEMQLKRIDVLMVHTKFNMAAARMMLDQTSVQNPSMFSCFQLAVNLFNQFEAAMSNVADLTLVSRIVSNPQEKGMIQPIVQRSIAAARQSGTEMSKAIQMIRSLPPCQGGDLPELSQNTTELVNSVEGTLAKMVE